MEKLKNKREIDKIMSWGYNWQIHTFLDISFFTTTILQRKILQYLKNKSNRLCQNIIESAQNCKQKLNCAKTVY
jgi:hypothetical protein